MPGPEIDATRVIADLRELDGLTGGPGGARRVCWGPEWAQARDWLSGKLGELGMEPDRDEAGNVWAYLEGDSDRALALGSHIDSVPSGGWLDGALGVAAALGYVRAWAESGLRPRRTLALVDFADEEGSRFGRSLFGSSAVAGTLDPASIETLTDADGNRIADVLAANGVELAEAPRAASRLDRIGSYLELHIEQGPVLEREGLPCAAVRGCAGVERERIHFTGQAAHAGTTPMGLRADAGLAAADVALAAERIAVEAGAGAVATTGRVDLVPGIITAVAGEASLSVDLRHPDASRLAAMHEALHDAARSAAEARGCTMEVEPVWRIAPIPFDADLVSAGVDAAAAAGGRPEALTSGALHDCAEIARHRPAAMIFTSSTRGLSHAREEDTPEDHLRAGIEAFGALATAALELEVRAWA